MNPSEDFQSTINQGGTIWMEKGVYKVRNTITVETPVRIEGEGFGETTDKASGEGGGAVRILWEGPEDCPVFDIRTNGWISGGAIKNVMIDGANRASHGVLAGGLKQWDLDLSIRRVKKAAIELSEPLCLFNNIKVHFVYGLPCEESSGLILGKSTQNIIDISGLIKHGNMITFGDADNNHIIRCHCSSVGEGRALEFLPASRNNVAWYAVGRIKSHPGSHGNIIYHLISEGSSVEGDLHCSTVDYIDGEKWSTHEFKLSDEISIGQESFTAFQGNVAQGKVAFLWPAVTFSGIGSTSACIPPPNDWNHGTIKAVKLFYASQVDADLNVKLKVTGGNQSLSTPQVSENFTVQAIGNQNVMVTKELDLSLDYEFEDFLNLYIKRTDSNSGVFHLLGAKIAYQGKGPDSPGSGPFVGLH